MPPATMCSAASIWRIGFILRRIEKTCGLSCLSARIGTTSEQMPFTHQSLSKATIVLLFECLFSYHKACGETGAVLIIGRWKRYV